MLDAGHVRRNWSLIIKKLAVSSKQSVPECGSPHVTKGLNEAAKEAGLPVWLLREGRMYKSPPLLCAELLSSGFSIAATSRGDQLRALAHGAM